jgi:serine/threonine protein kinase
VALKVFTPDLCTKEEWEARLQRAAELFATLSHPQVVPVQRAGWWDGAPFLAVEYVPQGSLDAKLVGEPMSLEAALRLVEQLTEVISYLHRQGVVHGNLKPSNVLLAADGIPRLVDFHPTGGWFLKPPSLDVASHLSPDPSLSGGRERVRTASLGYLAPELIKDSAAEPRPYTDIYGLGMILYELLTGRPAFVGSTAQEISELVGSQDPLPPSRFNSAVTPHLEGFCLRCLRRNPWQRYSRAYNLLTRLRHFQQELKDPEAPDER